jgi:putative photosynthetic complex assembly protein
MSEATYRHDVPRGALLAAGALILAAVLAVAIVRLSGVDIRTPEAPVFAGRELRFVDRADGSIVVSDSNGETVQVITGEAGFVRGVLRALARERMRRGVGPEQPFQLTAHTDGRLMLSDPVTGERVGLEAFGATNAAVFAQLLPPLAGSGRQSQPSLTNGEAAR